jgi:pimeloyl-ACP methyl ester carboxylesterase
MNIGCGTSIPIELDSIIQTKESITPATFERDNVELRQFRFGPSDRAHGWFFEHNEASCTVVYAGGQGFKMVLARGIVEQILSAVDVNLLMFDYRGNGQSTGELSVEVLKRDVLDAHRVAREKFNADCVIGHGHSLGSFLVSYLATERDLQGLVLEAPIVDAGMFFDNLLPWYLGLFLSFDVEPALAGESNREYLQHIGRTPVLLIAGEEDEIAGPMHVRRLQKVMKHPDVVKSHFIEQKGHNELLESTRASRSYRQLVWRVSD